MTAATSLLDFILRLLKDPQAQAEFRASPEQVLAANGLTDVSAADIRDTLPLVTDNRFVELNSSHAVAAAIVPAAGGSRIHGAIQYLHHITCTYRYDDHGAHAHDLGHGNIWAAGNVSPTFDDSHVGTGGPVPGPVTPGPGALGTGSWAGDGHGNSGHNSNLIYGDHNNDPSYGDTQDGPAGSSAGSAFRYSSHDQGDLHSFGSGATMTPAGGTGGPSAYSGDAVGYHDSTAFHSADSGFRPADSGGAVSPAGPDDYHTHDAHSSLGDSYYGHDSYYSQDSQHGTPDAQEPHIYLDLHLFGNRGAPYQLHEVGRRRGHLKTFHWHDERHAA